MISAIIQARMGSSRLPGKMLEQIEGKSVLGHVISRLKSCRYIDNITLATTDLEQDKALLEEARNYNIEAFPGNEKDVLDRYYQCAKKIGSKAIVRITGDCPFLDSKIVDEIILKFLNYDSDYSSNVRPRSFPDGIVAEVFSFEALEEAWTNAKLPSEREHVTPYIWKSPEKFKIVNVENDTDLSELRITLDHKEDLILLKKIGEAMRGRDYTLKNILSILKKNEGWTQINSAHKLDEGYDKTVKEEDSLVTK